MKYRKKPVVIEAIQWTCNNLNEVMNFIGSEFKYDANTDYVTSKFIFCKDSKMLQINTLEGTMLMSKGDYIIKGIKGEFYPCKPDVFEESYEEVTVDTIFMRKPAEHIVKAFIETMDVPGQIIVDRSNTQALEIIKMIEEKFKPFFESESIFFSSKS